MATAVELTRQGIAAANSGDTARAAGLLRQATEADPAYEMAWLWRSSVAASEDEKRAYLQQVLRVNPASAPARKGLALLGEAIEAPPELAAPVVAPPVAQPPAALGDDRTVLQRAIARHTADGWQIVFQAETTAQIKKPKQWSAGLLMFLVVAPAVIGCFWFPAFGIALIGLVLVLADHLTNKEELIFLDAAQLRRQEAENAAQSRRQHDTSAVVAEITRSIRGKPTEATPTWWRVVAVIMLGTVLIAGLLYWWYTSGPIGVQPARVAAPPLPTDPALVAPSAFGTITGYTESTGQRVVDIDLFDKPAGAAPPFRTVGHALEGQRVGILEQRADGTIKVRTPDGVEGWTQIDFVTDIR